MEKTAKIGILMVLLAFAVTACATSSNTWTPLPGPDSIRPLKIIPPEPNIPPAIAIYSGIWEGTWNNGRAVTIVIEHIKSPDEIIAIYSVGPYRDENESWRRIKGRATKNNSIELLQPEPFVILTIINEKQCFAKWKNTLSATLHKKVN